MNSKNKQCRLVLLDNNAIWDGDENLIAHWSATNMTGNPISIPVELEKSAARIKKEYLSWFYELGKIKLDGKNLVSYLTLFKNMSYWWMTLISEKDSGDNDAFYNIFKLKILEEIYIKNKCEGLVYCGENQKLHQIFRAWCNKMNHSYHHQPSQKLKAPFLTQRKFHVFKNFPFCLQALTYLCYRILLRMYYWKTIKVPHDKNQNTNKIKRATVITYFPNLDQGKAEQSIFRSKYWNDLHSVLEEFSISINWVLLYSKSETTTLKEAINFLDKFNEKRGMKNSFFFIDEFLTFGNFLKVCIGYLKIFRKGLRLHFIAKDFHFPGSSINFFPLLEYEWKSSFFGKDALKNLFFVYAFDTMASKLSSELWGLFVWENHGWEQGLISAWKRNGVKKIIGSQNTALRPFNLRTFNDNRVYEDSGKHLFNIPDILAVNGTCAMSILLSGNYPADHIKESEALRYMSLLNTNKPKAKKLTPSNRTLLVIMGMFQNNNFFQLSLLRDAAAMGGLNLYNKILIKPHPHLSISTLLENLNLEFDYEVVERPLSELWQKMDVAYCANSTSASVEAAWLGAPTIVVGASGNFNTSPLYLIQGNEFVMDAASLAQSLKFPSFAQAPDDFFYLDKELKRWISLLRN